MKRGIKKLKSLFKGYEVIEIEELTCLIRIKVKYDNIIFLMPDELKKCLYSVNIIGNNVLIFLSKDKLRYLK